MIGSTVAGREYIMTKATVVVATDNVSMILGDCVTVTFEGLEAQNEAVGYIAAMLKQGYWSIATTVYVLTINGQVYDYVLDAK